MSDSFSDCDEGTDYEDEESCCYEDEGFEFEDEECYCDDDDDDDDDGEEEEDAEGGGGDETDYEDEEINYSDREGGGGGGGGGGGYGIECECEEEETDSSGEDEEEEEGHEIEYEDEDEESDFYDEEDEEHDESEDEEFDRRNVFCPVFHGNNFVDLMRSSNSAPILTPEREATNERERQGREEPPSSGISVELRRGTVDLLSSSNSAPIPTPEREATNEGERQGREEPPSSGVLVESSEGSRSEIHGLFCPICMEALTNEGDHHICCLSCGHMYGMSCIKKWLEQRKDSAKCPQCNQRCTLKDVRKLFASPLITANEELQKRIQYLEAKCAALEQQTGGEAKSDTAITEEKVGYRSGNSSGLVSEGQIPPSQEALCEGEALQRAISDNSIRQDIAELRRQVAELKSLT